MLKFVSLSSGSSGNCYLLSDGTNAILIDAGVSFRSLKRNLMMLGCSLDMIRCVLVTHDHLDHIRHLGSFCKHLKVPVYATETLHRALASHLFTRDWIGPYRHILKEGMTEPVLTGLYDSVEDYPQVNCFEVPHDATQTVGYFIRWHGRSFFLMTDAGRGCRLCLQGGCGGDRVQLRPCDAVQRPLPSRTSDEDLPRERPSQQ